MILKYKDLLSNKHQKLHLQLYNKMTVKIFSQIKTVFPSKIQEKSLHNKAKKENLFKKEDQVKALALLTFTLKIIKVKSKLKSF